HRESRSAPPRRERKRDVGGGGGGGAGCVPGPASRLVPERNAPTACGRGSANRLRASSLCSHRKCGFLWYAAGTCDAVERDAQTGTRVSRAEAARALVQPDPGALHTEGLQRDGDICTRTLRRTFNTKKSKRDNVQLDAQRVPQRRARHLTLFSRTVVAVEMSTRCIYASERPIIANVNGKIQSARQVNDLLIVK
ncbi:hypothetical protein DFH11DRAFT_1653970, partial [Phellopilus nigrolimitatus]